MQTQYLAPIQSAQSHQGGSSVGVSVVEELVHLVFSSDKACNLAHTQTHDGVECRHDPCSMNVRMILY